jgi:membrane-associated protease RseP (regulator of RpoE activity)
MLKVEASGLKPVQWRNSKEAIVGKFVASPGIGIDPVAVGVVSVGARKFKQGDQPPKFSTANSGYLGVGLEAGEGGAKVNAVSPKSPAEKAGLKINDIIYEAAGRKIIDHEALINTVGRLKPKDEILLKVKRGAEDLEIKAVLGVRPKELKENPQETMGTKLSHRRGGFPVIIQHDSGVRPEDCGGPLVDLDGKTIGINIARAGRTETYAIPAEDVQALIPDLKSGKLAPKDDDPNLILFKVRGLTAKDPADQKRPKLGPDRKAKVEELKLDGGVTYVIELNTIEKFDPYLIIEDPKGKQIAEDDDGGGYPNAKLVFKAPSDGVYRIIATTFNPNETGGYALSVRRQAETPKEKAKDKAN